MFLCETTKEHTVQARVKSVQVGATHVTNARLGLSFPGFRCPTPNKALVNSTQVLLPIIHFKAVHMGAAGRTHDKPTYTLSGWGSEDTRGCSPERRRTGPDAPPSSLYSLSKLFVRSLPLTHVCVVAHLWRKMVTTTAILSPLSKCNLLGNQLISVSPAAVALPAAAWDADKAPDATALRTGKKRLQSRPVHT